jgi:alginate O-acetyltransferase complex protein AlgI
VLFYRGLFLVFVAVLLVASAACRRSVRARTWLLLVASYVFYAGWDWRFLFLIAGSTLICFEAARRMSGASQGRRKALLALSLVSNLGCLAVFKYLDFGIGSLNALLGAEIPLAELTLPVGISFFTFQSLSYAIDVYRHKLEPDPDLPTFALFVAFFPQLVAGPIIRASVFLPQVETALTRPLHDLTRAAPLFVFGMFKKVVIADRLGEVANAVFADPSAFGSGDRWLGTLAFSGQIYCDFSGYTDMALAMCLLLGFRFPLNFRSPYLSTGPQEFWRRWHISLSTWLRDYLYIPLGGSQSGRWRMVLALMGTMLLGGLWHGAAWTFVAWGAFHGTLLVLERLLLPADGGPKPLKVAMWPAFFVLTLVGWMIFRADSWANLALMADGLLQWQAPERVAWGLVAALMGYVAVEHVLSELNRKRGWTERWPALAFAVAGVLLPLCFLLRADRSAEFIYFQF